MKHLSSAAVLAITLPAAAETLTEQGVTREQVIKIMTAHGLPARIDKDSSGNMIVKSRVDDINFDVYFFDCTDASCREILFAAGWSNNTASADKINEWITTKRYIRAYSKPGKVIWAEQDVIIGRTTTENIGEYLTMWSSTIARFKEFMNL